MIKKLIVIFILGAVNTIVFLVIAGYLYISFWANNPQAFAIPIGFYLALIVVLCLLFSYLITVHIIKFVPFLSQAKATSIKETVVLTIIGFIVGAGILFIRDFIPRYFYEKQQTSINNFRREAPSIIEVSQPVFVAEKDYMNVPKDVDQFRFTIEMPLKINKSFDENQILDTFRISFASQGDKIFVPPIEECYTDTLQLPLGIYPQLKKEANMPGYYTLKFSYNYVRKSPAYSQCSVTSVHKLQGKNIILFVWGEIPGGKAIGTYPIETIQYK